MRREAGATTLSELLNVEAAFTVTGLLNVEAPFTWRPPRIAPCWTSNPGLAVIVTFPTNVAVPPTFKFNPSVVIPGVLFMVLVDGNHAN
jgi:hypothetical protein